MMEINEALDRARQGIAALPSVVKLMVALIRDPRVPRRIKLLLAGSVAYAFLPGDLLPDWVPGIGIADDLLVIVLALDALFNHVDEEVIAEHWEGDREILDKLREILAFASTFVPASVKEQLLEESS